MNQFCFSLLIFLSFYAAVFGRPLTNDEGEAQDFDEDNLAQRIFNSTDADKDGGLTFEEIMDAFENGNRCFLGRENRLDDEFRGIDTDGDEKLQLEEAVAAQNGTFHSTEAGKDPKALFIEIDTNPTDGGITREEFIAYIAHQMRSQEEQQTTVKDGFKKADSNGDGKLQLGEMLAMEEANKRGQSEFNRLAASLTSAAMQFECQ